VKDMNDSADILMLHGVARDCPDCVGERIFVPVDETGLDSCELCCTDCGAAVLADPALDYVRDGATSAA
jgi:hypothetical protein